uniref:Uncharacterized protein n=1 Tax=Romanomermis culicivorax TaxID=13658 RepID=A0A915HUD1_ROMCU
MDITKTAENKITTQITPPVNLRNRRPVLKKVACAPRTRGFVVSSHHILESCNNCSFFCNIDLITVSSPKKASLKNFGMKHASVYKQSPTKENSVINVRGMIPGSLKEP